LLVKPVTNVGHGESRAPAKSAAISTHDLAQSVTTANKPKGMDAEPAYAPVSPKQRSEPPAATSSSRAAPDAAAHAPENATSRSAVGVTSAAAAAADVPANGADEQPAAGAAAAADAASACGQPVSADRTAASGSPSDSYPQAGESPHSSNSGSGMADAVSRARLESTMPLLVGGSHIAVRTTFELRIEQHECMGTMPAPPA